MVHFGKKHMEYIKDTAHRPLSKTNSIHWDIIQQNSYSHDMSLCYRVLHKKQPLCADGRFDTERYLRDPKHKDPGHGT
jgi:hypothetical protein